MGRVRPLQIVRIRHFSLLLANAEYQRQSFIGSHSLMLSGHPELFKNVFFFLLHLLPWGPYTLFCTYFNCLCNRLANTGVHVAGSRLPSSGTGNSLSFPCDKVLVSECLQLQACFCVASASRPYFQWLNVTAIYGWRWTSLFWWLADLLKQMEKKCLSCWNVYSAV